MFLLHSGSINVTIICKAFFYGFWYALSVSSPQVLLLFHPPFRDQHFTCQVRSLRRGLHDVLGSRTGALWLFSPLEQGTPRKLVELVSLNRPWHGSGAGHGLRVDDLFRESPFWVGYVIFENVSENGFNSAELLYFWIMNLMFVCSNMQHGCSDFGIW